MRLFKIQIVILLQIMVCGAVIADLPKNITKCRSGDGECFTTLINKIIKMFPKGNPEIGLIPLNAIPHDGYFLVKPRNSTAFEFSLEVKQQTIYGIENTTITRVEGFKKDPLSANFEVHGRIPRILLIGQYELEGKFFFFTPHNGGPFKIEFLNLQFGIKVKIIQLFRNNKTYLEVYDVIPNFNMDRLIFNLENLYPDNSDFSDAINQAVSENWREVYNELEEPVIKIVSDQVKDMLNKIGRILSYDDLFLE